MKFLNKRTGAVIDVPCRLEGPDWIDVTEAKEPEPEEKVEKPVKAPAKAAPKKRTAGKRS